MQEIWKDIKGFEELYQISNYGNVKSLKGKKERVLKPYIRNNYYAVSLCKNNKHKNYRINRLVAEMFIFNPNNLPEVNHLDGNKLNNCVYNLEWCSRSENQRHAIKNKLRKKDYVSKEIVQYDINNNYIKIWENARKASSQLNIDYRCISACCNNKQKTAGNYIWKFKREENN